MIIGNGLLAQAFAPEFNERDDIIVFASGVSNSKETRAEQFEREHALLRAALAQRKFLLYFSTCSVHDPELLASPYVRHKLAMEALIRDSAEQMAIFRLPQVVGHTPNPHTLTNYLYRQISGGHPFQVWLRAWRNLIDVSDVVAIVHHLVENHQADGVVTNVACPFSIAVTELVAIFETVLDRRARYDTVDAGGHYEIDVTLAAAVATRAGLRYDDHYLPQLIKKYYAH